MIHVKNLCKSFSEKQILHGIDLDIQENETVAIIGPSGSGKSTLLRCLNLLEEPEEGSVSIADVSYSAGEVDKKTELDIRRCTAMVFQNWNLFANYNVEKNITLPLMKVQNIPEEQAKIKAHELLEKVGLADRKDAMPHQLSGGQQQRVAIARAVALAPKAILFDEPTSALDPELIQGVLEVIQDISKSMTSVIVTHEISFAAEAADRVLFMDQGRIIEQGPAQDVIYHPKEERTRQFLSSLLKKA